MVCTVTGCTERAGAGEFAVGTPLVEVISTLGGPPRGKQIVAVLSGTDNAFLPADLLDVPLSWEGLASVGSGLGSAGFIVIDDTGDIVAVAPGVSRILAVESCSQGPPSNHNGMTIPAPLPHPRATTTATPPPLLP